MKKYLLSIMLVLTFIFGTQSCEAIHIKPLSCKEKCAIIALAPVAISVAIAALPIAVTAVLIKSAMKSKKKVCKKRQAYKQARSHKS